MSQFARDARAAIEMEAATFLSPTQRTTLPRNVRDRTGDTLTPVDQSETEGDRRLTQDIRKAIVADDSLSITAKNVKIITINGVVTLRGPVNTEEERQSILEKAKGIAGVQNVVNQLEAKRQP